MCDLSAKIKQIRISLVDLFERYSYQRFLHEDSPVPFFKLGPKAVIQAGRVRTTTAILFSSDSTIAKPFLHLLKVMYNVQWETFKTQNW